MDSANTTDNQRLLRQVLTELVDSVANADRVRDYKAEITAIESRKADRVNRERNILNEVNKILEAYSNEEKVDAFKMYRDTISDFVAASLKEYEKRLNLSIDQELSEKNAEMDSYRAKSIRAIEAFLSRNPLAAIESDTILKYVAGGYETRYRCTCPKEIEYEFLLNSSEVEFLKGRADGATLKKGLRFPVRLAKTWVSKDPAVDFERFDNYYLSAASMSDSNLFVTFSNDETGSELKFHSSSSNGSNFLEIDYKDSLQSVSLTSQPAFNNGIDREAVTSLMNQINLALVHLNDYKIRLLKLTLRGVDVIANLKVMDTLYTILEILAPQLSDEVTKILTQDGNENTNTDKSMNRDFVNSRLALLGDRAATVSSLLGITGYTDSIH